MSRRRVFHKPLNRSRREDRTFDGIVFDSKAEMRRYQQLLLEVRAGVVKDIRRQERFKLIIPNGNPIMVGSRIAVYKPDFVYRRINRAGEWELIFEDVKGIMTTDARLRIAVFEAIYKVKVSIVSK